MSERVVKPAVYVIEQSDGAGSVVSSEQLSWGVHESNVRARAHELETLRPGLVTTWYLRGEVTENDGFPGRVIEQMAVGARVFDVIGADAVSARVVGFDDLPIMFVLQGPSPDGSVVEFFDIDSNKVAEVKL